jgi:hypothetical protein
MKKFRLFLTVLFLLIALAVIALIAIFDNIILFKAAGLIKQNIWPASIALFIFLILLSAGIVSNLSTARGSVFGNGYFQLAILELFLAAAALAWYWYYLQQPGKFVFQLRPAAEKEKIQLVLQCKTPHSISVDTVTAPGVRHNMPAGDYRLETLDPDIVQYRTDIVLKPAETETIMIPVTINTRTLVVQTDPPGAQIRINGVQATLTPDTLRILSGDTVIIELQMAGYQDYRDTLRLDKDTDLGTIRLLKSYTLWISSRYPDNHYIIYDTDNRLVLSGNGSRKLQLAAGTYRIAYEIGEGQYDTKRVILNYNKTISIP